MKSKLRNLFYDLLIKLLIFTLPNKINQSLIDNMPDEKLGPNKRVIY